MKSICLDYGHGGRDPGAVYKGRMESADNLLIGRMVAKRLISLGIEVGETRSRDLFRSLEERVNFANRGNYDYFISFHRNAFKPELASGAETFIYHRPSPKARELAQAIQGVLVQSGFRNRGVKTAGFYVLRKTKMPAILIELGFIDNSSDNDLFDSSREKIADGIARAIYLTS